MPVPVLEMWIRDMRRRPMRLGRLSFVWMSSKLPRHHRGERSRGDHRGNHMLALHASLRTITAIGGRKDHPVEESPIPTSPPFSSVTRRVAIAITRIRESIQLLSSRLALR